MRILIMANDSMGLFLFRKELIDELLKNNVIFISAPYEKHIENLIEQGCVFLDTSLERRGMNPVKDFALFKFYFSTIREVKPDIVLTYTIKPNVYGGLACGILHIPYLSNITGLGTSIQNGGPVAKLSLMLYKIGLKKTKCAFFQNETNRRFFVTKGIAKGKTRLVPGSGVNLQLHYAEPYPDEKDGMRFLFVGRIMRDKGIGELIEAFKTIHSRYPNVSIDVVGPEEEDYMVAFREAEDVVRYLGPQTDMHSFYKNCHCVVLPSYHEGTANVMLEASATARPVITTTVPGCRETFDEGVTGFGCGAKDTDSLVAAIEKFMKLSHEERAQMGLNARAKMEREYDRQHVIDAYKEEIELITKEKFK